VQEAAIKPPRERTDCTVIEREPEDGASGGSRRSPGRKAAHDRGKRRECAATRAQGEAEAEIIFQERRTKAKP